MYVTCPRFSAELKLDRIRRQAAALHVRQLTSRRTRKPASIPVSLPLYLSLARITFFHSSSTLVFADEYDGYDRKASAPRPTARYARRPCDR